MKKNIFITMFAVILLLLAGCGSDQSSSEGEIDDEKQYLNLGATSQSSSAYPLFVEIADGIEAGTEKDLQVSVVETGATVDNIKRLRNNEIDFGLGTESVNYEAYNGTGDWEDDGAFTELRGMYSMVMSAQPIVVTKESNIANVDELEGESFFPGFTGSASEKATQEVLSSLDVKPDYINGDLSDGTKALKDRKSVGYVTTGAGDSPDPNTIDINGTVPLTLIGFDDDQLEKIEEIGYSIVTIPGGNYPNQDEDIDTYAIVTNMITTTDLSEETVYQMMENIIPNKDKHAEVYKAVEYTEDYIESTLETQQIPLHSGVVKYFEDQGIDVPEDLIPEEYEK